MRLSKQICFLVAAAVASAVDGAPIGDKLQRRQAINLELTPTQQVDVDGSSDMPRILISDNGYQLGQSNCIGGNCESYAINMPPIKQIEEYTVPHTSYDPYAENYSPYPTYPPSRSNLYSSPPFPSQVISAGGPPHVVGMPSQAAADTPPKWTNAGWNAPLIPSGTFADELKGTPTTPPLLMPTSTTSAPGPVPIAVTQAEGVPPAGLPTNQPAPPAPLPFNAASAGALGATPTTLPFLPPAGELKDQKKEGEVKPGDAPPMMPPASTPDFKKIANEAAVASNREQAESKPSTQAPGPGPAPALQRRGLRSGKSKPAPIKKRSPAPKRLQKRQLDTLPTEAAPVECEPTKVEVLVPVTEEELASIQDGSSQIVSYPSVNPDGTEEKLYDVLPVTQEPALSLPDIKSIYESHGEQQMPESESRSEQGQENQATSQKVSEERSLDNGSDELLRSRSLNAGAHETPNFSTLEKRLKHGSNGLNASMVGNGAGKTKYGFTIHDNKNGASSLSSLGVCTTMALAVTLGVWATLL